MALNTRLERNKALRMAYRWARAGNTYWTQQWLNRANSFLQVSDRTIKRLQRTLDNGLAKKRNHLVGQGVQPTKEDLHNAV